MKEMLNMTTIQRFLKYLSILLLIAGKPSFLTASGRDVVVINFGGGKITQKGLLEGLKKDRKWYIERCEELAKNFERINKNEDLRFDDYLNGDLMREYVIPFYKLIMVGNLDFDSIRNRVVNGDKGYRERCVHLAKFFWLSRV